MSADIIIGIHDRTTGADIVIGDDEPIVAGDPSVIEFEIPRVPKGTMLLALVVRNQEVTALAGWDKKIDGNGGGAFRLDGWARMVDDADLRGEDEALAIAPFLSVASQELQGRLYVFENTAGAYMIEAIETDVFVADATPTAPAVLSQQAVNRLVLVLSSTGEIDFDPPAGYTVDDAYSSSVVAPRSVMFASKVGNASGLIAPGNGAAAPAATGRSWTIVVRNNPPLIPGELADVVPGHIGLIGPR